MLLIWQYRRNRVVRSWGEFASRNGFSLRNTGGWFKTPEVVGNYRGRPVKLHYYTVGGGDEGGSTTYCQLRLKMSHRFEGCLELCHEGFLQKVGKVFGKEDIQLHDPVFDQRYIIKCSHPELPPYVLDYWTRQRLLAYTEWWFHWERTEAVAKRVNLEYSPARLHNLMDILSKVADELELRAAAVRESGESKTLKTSDGQRSAVCPSCSGPVKFKREKNKWGCPRCKKYVTPIMQRSRAPPRAPPRPDRCPQCGARAEYSEEYNDYYCWGCEEYIGDM